MNLLSVTSQMLQRLKLDGKRRRMSVSINTNLFEKLSSHPRGKGDTNIVYKEHNTGNSV